MNNLQKTEAPQKESGYLWSMLEYFQVDAIMEVQLSNDPMD